MSEQRAARSGTRSLYGAGMQGLGETNIPSSHPIRLLVAAIMSNATKQLFDAPVVSVSFKIKNVDEIKGPNSKPSDIDFEFEAEIQESYEYRMALFWFLKDDTDNVFSLKPCCDVLGFSSIDRIRDRVIWVEDLRRKKLEVKQRNLKLLRVIENIFFPKEEIKQKLFEYYERHPDKSEFEIRFSQKMLPWGRYFERMFNEKFDLRKSTS